MFASLVPVLALLAAAGSSDLPPYQTELYKGLAGVYMDEKHPIYIPDKQCSGVFYTGILGRDCRKHGAHAMRVVVHDYQPRSNISIDDALTTVKIWRNLDKAGQCEGEALVQVFANCMLWRRNLEPEQKARSSVKS